MAVLSWWSDLSGFPAGPPTQSISHRISINVVSSNVKPLEAKA